MRILQVSSPLRLGGAETHVIELAEGLRKRGHHVVVAGRRNGAAKPQVHFPFRNSLDLYTVLRVRSLLKKDRFDVVHAHVARDYSLVAAAAWGLPVKLVLTRHLLLPIASHFLYSRVDGWIAPTNQILKTLSPVRPRVTAVIPNWVDLGKFPFQPHPPHDPVSLAVLGQIAPHKGHDDAIEALRNLGPGYRLIIAGQGKDDYVQALKRKAQGMPVEFAGFVALPQFFEMVDVLLTPSWEEPFGIVLLEAMAGGVPVISTAAGGPLDIVRSGVDGILVPPNNPFALADAIRSIASQREKLVRAARARVETAFDIAGVVPRVEAFYRSI